jgi:hypothetical protein
LLPPLICPEQSAQVISQTANGSGAVTATRPVTTVTGKIASHHRTADDWKLAVPVSGHLYARGLFYPLQMGSDVGPMRALLLCLLNQLVDVPAVRNPNRDPFFLFHYTDLITLTVCGERKVGGV